MTLKPLFRFFLIISVFTCFGQSPASGQEAKTFLYKISGNGLSSTSYLYGTIHLQDSRLFNFQDSLYRYLEQSTSFAMEINPDSITQAVMDMQFKGGKKVLMKDRVSKQSLENIKKRYQYMCSEPIESLSLAELLYYVKAYYSKYDEREKMPAFMDMYLMGMASKLGKDVLGLERVEDQFNLFESLLEGKEPEEILSAMGDRRKEGESLVKAYIKTDMRGVAKMNAVMPPEIEALLLTNRNLVLLDGMEKLMAKGSLFTAVGVAHLPGKDGLVQLLRNKGYTVTPELSTARTHAKSYRSPGKPGDALWKTHVAEKDGYSVQMPGDPATNTIPQSGSDMYTYIRWETNEYYYAFHYAVPNDVSTGNRDSILKEMLNNSVNNMKGKIISPMQPVEKSGLKGFEVTSSGGDKLFYKIILLNNENDIYMLMKGVQAKENLTNEDADRFFGSLKMVPKKLAAMESFVDRDLGFSIQLPGKPTQSVEDEEGSESKRVTYFAKSGNIEFLVIVASCNPGYQFNNDTLSLGNFRRNIKEMTDTGYLEESGLFQAGYPLWDFSGFSKDGSAIRIKYIQRGSRMYFLWIYAPKSADITTQSETYFNSFSLLPYMDPEITMVEKDSIYFATTNGNVQYAQTYGETDSSSIIVYHKALASSMIFSSSAISPMAWATSDSAYLRYFVVKENNLKEDEILDENFLEHDGLPAYDMLMKGKLSHQALKQRLIKKGNTLYLLSMEMEPSVSNLPSVQTMFNKVKINRQHPAFDLRSNSAEKVFLSLDTAAEESFRKIIYSFDDLPFTRADLPFLLKKGSVLHAKDTLGYPSLERAVWGQIENIADSNDIPLLEQTWKTIPSDTNSSARSYLLDQLAEIGTKDAIISLKHLFYPDYEKDPSVGLLFNTLARNKRTYEVVLPDWYSLLSDKRYAYAILHLYNEAKDSNYTLAPPPPGFEDTVLSIGKSVLQEGNKDDYVSFEMDLVKTLEGFRSRNANDMLLQLAIDGEIDEYLRYEAIMALVRNGEEPVKALEMIAALPYWRGSLLDDLEEMDKPELFPEKYRNQPAMAEAYLYDSFEDETPDKVEPIGTRTAKYEGKTYLFYLYKLGYTWEGKTEYYLGISGPFDPVGNDYKMALKDAWLCGMAGDEFDRKRIDKQLASYLQSLEAPPEIEKLEE